MVPVEEVSGVLPGQSILYTHLEPDCPRVGGSVRTDECYPETEDDETDQPHVAYDQAGNR